MTTIAWRRIRAPSQIWLAWLLKTRRSARVLLSTRISFHVPRCSTWRTSAFPSRSAHTTTSTKSKSIFLLKRLESQIVTVCSYLYFTVPSLKALNMRFRGTESVLQALTRPSEWTRPLSWTRSWKSNSKHICRCTRCSSRSNLSRSSKLRMISSRPSKMLLRQLPSTKTKEEKETLMPSGPRLLITCGTSTTRTTLVS